MVEEIGMSAGKVWQCLKENGELNPSVIIKKTGLKRDTLFAAVGWLAREGKLRFREENRSTLISLA